MMDLVEPFLDGAIIGASVGIFVWLIRSFLTKSKGGKK